MPTLGQRIRGVRKYYSRTQKEFSDVVGVSQSFLSEVENDRSSPSIELIQGIAVHFPHIRLDWLLTGTGEMAPDYDEYVKEERNLQNKENLLVLEVAFLIMDDAFQDFESDRLSAHARAQLFSQILFRIDNRVRDAFRAGETDAAKLARRAKRAGPFEVTELIASL